MKAMMRFLPAAVVLAAAVVLLPGCGDGDATALASGPKSDASQSPDAPGAGFGPFANVTVDDLDQRLGLSATQHDQMEDVLDRLHDARREMRPRGRGGPLRGLRGGVEEPPVIRFLEETSKILTPDQFKELARFAGERRDEFMRDGGPRRALGAMKDRGERWLGRGGHGGRFGDRRTGEMVEWRLENMRDHLGRRADFLGRVLGLDESQTAEVRGLLLATADERARILGELRDGGLEPEEAAERIGSIEEDVASRIEGLLTREQKERWDVIRDLLPRPR